MSIDQESQHLGTPPDGIDLYFQLPTGSLPEHSRALVSAQHFPEMQPPPPVFPPPQSQTVVVPMMYAPPRPMPSQTPPGEGLGITGMILGISSLVFLIVLVVISPILSSTGLILSIIARKQGASGVAVAGIVCSAISLSLFIIGLVAVLLFFSALLAPLGI
ncbi:MAG: DUF4190 domain-containing protein [Propionibacteriaceae bacterium]|nr:DUF4190 domain-containing protein [Propionibacteriaceae bacterium]